MKADKLEQVKQLIKEVKTITEKVSLLKKEEQATFEALDEDAQESEEGATITENAENLEAAESSLDEAHDFLVNVE